MPDRTRPLLNVFTIALATSAAVPAPAILQRAPHQIAVR